MTEKQCQSRLNRQFGYCARKPTVERDGKPYCWQHDPERLRAKSRERWEAERARQATRDAEWDARDRRRQLERDSGVANLTDADLEVIITMGGMKALMKRMPS